MFTQSDRIAEVWDPTIKSTPSFQTRFEEFAHMLKSVANVVGRRSSLVRMASPSNIFIRTAASSVSLLDVWIYDGTG